MVVDTRQWLSWLPQQQQSTCKGGDRGLNLSKQEQRFANSSFFNFFVGPKNCEAGHLNLSACLRACLLYAKPAYLCVHKAYLPF